MQKLTKKTPILILLLAALFLSFGFYCMIIYERKGRHGDESYLENIRAGELPENLRGVSLIEINNKQLKVVFNPPYAHNESLTQHNDYVASRLTFAPDESLSNYVNSKHTYNDPQALNSVLLYSLVIGGDRYISQFEENLYLKSFDGQKADFFVLIAKRSGDTYVPVLKKDFLITKTYFSLEEIDRMRHK